MVSVTAVSTELFPSLRTYGGRTPGSGLPGAAPGGFVLWCAWLETPRRPRAALAGETRVLEWALRSRPGLAIPALCSGSKRQNLMPNTIVSLQKEQIEISWRDLN